MAEALMVDPTTRLLGKALDVSARRHRLIASNLANMDTIGYKPKDLDFRKTLERALEKHPQSLSHTHPKHFKVGVDNPTKGVVRSSEEAQRGPDPVNIDVEMSHLVENNLKYRTSVELLLRKMGMLRQAITEGGR